MIAESPAPASDETRQAALGAAECLAASGTAMVEAAQAIWLREGRTDQSRMN
jgi:hypothetical protein